MQDPNKVVLGATGSSARVVTPEDSDPAEFPAGQAVRKASTGALSLSSGTLIGVSLGRDLSCTDHTAVCRQGLKIPLILTDESVASSLVVGDLTFKAKAKGVEGDAITIALLDTESGAGAVVTVDGTDISVSIEGGVTTAQTIATAIEASEDAAALVTVEIAESKESTAQAAAPKANLDNGAEPYAYVTDGGAVIVSSTTGKAASTGTATGAIYTDGQVLKGIDTKTRTEVDCVFIDMVGGL